MFGCTMVQTVVDRLVAPWRELIKTVSFCFSPDICSAFEKKSLSLKNALGKEVNSFSF